MPIETVVHTEETQAASNRTAEQPRVAPLEQVVEDIRVDCKRSAAKYLEETRVPHGGE